MTAMSPMTTMRNPMSMTHEEPYDCHESCDYHEESYEYDP